MVDAIARGAGVPVDEVRRAHMFSGDLGETARQALAGGVDALRTVTLVPGRAVGPMLAAPADGVAEALAETGEASVEWKLDGARVQAHRRAGDVRLFTRNLNDITDRLPGVVSLVAGPAGGRSRARRRGRRVDRGRWAAAVPGHDGRLRRPGRGTDAAVGWPPTSSTSSTRAARRSSTSRCRPGGPCSTSWSRRRSACPRSSRPTPTRRRRSWTTPSAVASKA